MPLGMAVSPGAAHADAGATGPATVSSSPALASGILTDPSGVPIAGVPVSLLAWPDIAALAALADGESIDFPIIARAVTASDGSYSLGGGSTAVSNAADAAGADGLVDLQVQASVSAVNGGIVSSPGFSARVESRAGAKILSAVATGAVLGAAGVSQRIDLALTAPSKVILSGVARSGAQQARAVRADAGPTAGGHDVVIQSTQNCGATKVKSYPRTPVIVGRMYSTTSKIKSLFELRTNAETTVGVASSVSGKYGAFSQSNTTTVKLSDSYTWEKATLKGGRQYITDYTYARFANWCYPVYSPPSSKHTYLYTVRPVRWEGGGRTAVEKVPTTPASNCRVFSALSHQSKTTSTATTTKNGVKLDHVLGIDLTSKAGYTSSAKAVMYNVSSNGRHICGTSGTPSAPGRLVAKK